MEGLSRPFRLLAREAGDAARAALRRGALISAAALIGALGAGFLLFAGYVGLRLLLGPGLVALVMGGALLALAACLILVAQGAGSRSKQKTPADPPQGLPPKAPPHPADTAAMAVFAAAFLVGRTLADRWDQSRNS